MELVGFLSRREQVAEIQRLLALRELPPARTGIKAGALVEITTSGGDKEVFPLKTRVSAARFQMQINDMKCHGAR